MWTDLDLALGFTYTINLMKIINKMTALILRPSTKYFQIFINMVEYIIFLFVYFLYGPDVMFILDLRIAM